MATEDAVSSKAPRSATLPKVWKSWSQKISDWNSVSDAPFTTLMSPTKRAEETWREEQMIEKTKEDKEKEQEKRRIRQSSVRAVSCED